MSAPSVLLSRPAGAEVVHHQRGQYPVSIAQRACTLGLSQRTKHCPRPIALVFLFHAHWYDTVESFSRHSNPPDATRVESAQVHGLWVAMTNPKTPRAHELYLLS